MENGKIGGFRTPKSLNRLTYTGEHLQSISYTVDSIDREFVTSAKKIANFNDFPKLKKFVKIRKKIR